MRQVWRHYVERHLYLVCSVIVLDGNRIILIVHFCSACPGSPIPLTQRLYRQIKLTITTIWILKSCLTHHTTVSSDVVLSYIETLRG